MKVSIKENGIILIESETELESYALYKWCDDNKDCMGKNITIKVGLNNEGIELWYDKEKKLHI